MGRKQIPQIKLKAANRSFQLLTMYNYSDLEIDCERITTFHGATWILGV